MPKPGSTPIYVTIHFVPPERVRMEPHELLTACGTWSRGPDWSTNPRVVSCPLCLAVAAGRDAAHVQHAPPPPMG